VFVATKGLAFPDEAKIVRAESDGMPIADGVFPEAKEFLMGYWIADVESPEQLRIGSPLRIRNGSG
jgi:hypothetical protein